MVEALTIQANRPKVLVDREPKPSLPKSQAQLDIEMYLQLRSHHLGIVAVYDKQIARLKQK